MINLISILTLYSVIEASLVRFIGAKSAVGSFYDYWSGLPSRQYQHLWIQARSRGCSFCGDGHAGVDSEQERHRGCSGSVVLAI